MAKTESDSTALQKACGSIPLDVRVAVLFLGAAAADGKVSDKEMAHVMEVAEGVLTEIDPKADPKGIPAAIAALKDFGATLKETVDIFGKHLGDDVRIEIFEELEGMIADEGDTEDEEEFLAQVAEAWGIEEDDGDDDDDDDEEEEEDEAS